MSEYEFVLMAVSECNQVIGVEHKPYNIARTRMAGFIGFDVDTKEEFLAKGIRFLDSFEDDAMAEIGEIEEHYPDNPDSQGTIAEIRSLIYKSKNIDRDVFLNMLSSDWDERHQEEAEVA